MESLLIKFTDKAMLTKAGGAVIKIPTSLSEVSDGRVRGVSVLGSEEWISEGRGVRQKHSDASGFRVNHPPDKCLEEMELFQERWRCSGVSNVQRGREWKAETVRAGETQDQVTTESC